MAIELQVPPEYRQNLPSGGAEFLDELGESLDGDAVRSVFLFGSVVSGEATEVSDIDLLIVLEDATEDAYEESVRERCLQLAETHLAAEQSRGSRIDRYIDKLTGMFRSGFVTRANDIEAGQFHSIFNTSRLAYPVAPWRTVLAAVFDTTTPVYGPSIVPDWHEVEPPTNRPLGELSRSLLLSLVLSSSQLLYGFVSPRAILYAMEAHKWTLYNCAFHLVGGPTQSLPRASGIVPGSDRFDQRLRNLRRDHRYDVSYLIVVPFYVVLVHVRTMIAIVYRSDAKATRK